MRAQPHPLGRPRETGAITILVCLLMLILLTVASLGMSKNSLRSAIASATLRQSTEAGNIADAGLEWAVFWLASDPNNPPVRPAATGGAQALQSVQTTLQSTGSFGVPTPVVYSPATDFTLSSGAGITQGYALSLTLMGQLTPFLTSMQQGKSTTDFTPTALNLWAVRADGNVAFGNGMTFSRRREVWLTLPPQ